MTITHLLRAVLPYRDIGWSYIGEDFTRFTVLWTPWFAVYLHRLIAPNAHPECHDHPWSFVAVLLRGGYYEFHDGEWTWHRAGSVLYRPATYRHNVVTKRERVSWSVIVTGSKRRDWGFVECRRAA